jgi:hypothetical protein
MSSSQLIREPMSARYSTVVAMLDDDANFACVVRELSRRGEHKLALPPQTGANGTVCYMSFRWHLGGATDVEEADRSDILAEIWSEVGSNTPKWWITLQDGTEVGPFDYKMEAQSEAIRFLRRDGWRMVEQEPWDAEDLGEWPA